MIFSPFPLRFSAVPQCLQPTNLLSLPGATEKQMARALEPDPETIRFRAARTHPLIHAPHTGNASLPLPGATLPCSPAAAAKSALLPATSAFSFSALRQSSSLRRAPAPTPLPSLPIRLL